MNLVTALGAITHRQGLLIISLLVSVVCGFSQSSRGTVTGIVTDPQAASIPGATVELTNRATNVKRETSTNEAGFSRFDAVDLGTYDLAVKSQGFQTYVQREIPVLANQTASLDVRLEIGDTQTLIEVVAETTTVLQYEAPVRGGNWGSKQITELAIAGRNAVSLASRASLIS